MIKAQVTIFTVVTGCISSLHTICAPSPLPWEYAFPWLLTCALANSVFYSH